MSKKAPDWVEAPDWAEALGLRIYESDTAAIDYAWVSRHGYHYASSNVVDKKCHPFDLCGTGIRDFKLISFRPLGPAAATETFPEWSGEGLPPIGTICHCLYKGMDQGEVRVEYIGKNACVLLNLFHGDEQCGMTEYYLFTPIRTPEQIAAEERRAAIECLAGELGGHWSEDAKAPHRDMAAYLYDSGWRKQEPKPE